MTDPKRLFELPGLEPVSRLALEEARAMEPPAELREEVWKALGATVLPAALGATSALSEGGAAGSHAGAKAVAGGKATAVGVASHVSLAVFPAVKVMAVAAVLFGSAAGVGFTVGRSWSERLNVSAKADFVETEQAPRVAAPMRSASPPASASAALAGSHELSLTERARDTSAVTTSEPAVAGNGNGGANGGVALGGTSADGMRDRAAPSQVPRALASAPANRANGAVPSRTASATVAPVASEGLRAIAGVSPSASETPLALNELTAEDQESRLVAAAREALRASDPQRTLTLLESARGLGSKGVLVQERELLGIEALVHLGERDAARERARVFLRTWPESPYAGRVQATLQTL